MLATFANADADRFKIAEFPPGKGFLVSIKTTLLHGKTLTRPFTTFYSLHPMSITPPLGSIRMAAPVNTTGGVQFAVSQFPYFMLVLTTLQQGNQHVHPHIVVSHGTHDIHVAPVSTTKDPVFRPHMSVQGMAPGLSGNGHLGHVTAQECHLLPPLADLRDAQTLVCTMLMPSTRVRLLRFLFLAATSDLHISSKANRAFSGPSACGPRALSRGKCPPPLSGRTHRRHESPYCGRAGQPKRCPLFTTQSPKNTALVLRCTNSIQALTKLLGRVTGQRHSTSPHAPHSTLPMSPLSLRAQWSCEAAWASYDRAQASGVSHISSS